MAAELNEKRYLGLDYGDKTVGVAVSDPLGLTAQAVETIHRERPTKLRRTMARIDELIDQYKVTELVLGFPRNLDHSVGVRGEKTIEFQQKLEKRTGLPVLLWDERLTTNAADRVLEESGIRQIHRKEYVDEIAAALILQSFLDRQAFERSQSDS